MGPEWWIAAVGAVLLLVSARGYGYFRDELYYLACAERLAWGYVDHPPLSIVLLAIDRALFGDSLLALRWLPSLAVAVAAGLAGSLARQLGGGTWAAALAAVATLLAPGMLAFSGFYSMNAFDLLFWLALFLVAAKILRGGDPRWWLGFGALAGLGLQNKISVLFLGFGIAVGLLAARRWEHLGRRWLWLGGLLAAVLFAPYLGWQVARGWPTIEFMANATEYKNVVLGPLAFLAEVTLLAGPVALPLWLVGAFWLSSSRSNRELRPLAWAWWTILAVMLLTASKPYYLLPALPLLFAAGAVAVEGWSASEGRRRWRPALVTMLVVGNLAVAPLSRALLPVESFVRYASWLGVAPSSGERHEMGALPQHFADMHGWRELAESVAEVVATLPPEERDRACVFAQNYGQAGALELWQEDLDLPPVIAGHNNYWLWGPRGCSGEVLVVIDGEREELAELFAEVRLATTFRCRYCMPYENDKEIWVGRHPFQPLPELWPATKHYD